MYKKILIVVAFAMAVGFSYRSVVAAPLEDVLVQQKDDGVVAVIKLTSQVHYLRHFPTQSTKHLEIFYDRVGTTSTEPWVDFETRKVLATTVTPAFTISSRDQNVAPKLVIDFEKEVEFSLKPSVDGRSFIISVSALKQANFGAIGALQQLPIVAPLATEDVSTAEVGFSQQGHDLMVAGRDALAKKDYDFAIQTFNKLLLLPPNQYSQDAQEWVGVSRERAGQLAKAKAEYELYLKLYKTGPGVDSVKLRLSKLATESSQKVQSSSQRNEQERTFVQGSISSHYYYGKSDVTSKANPNLPTTWADSTVSLVDQSSLISYADATARYTNERYDNRIVFRDQVTQNFVGRQGNTNRIYAAYLELKDRSSEYSARLGRQSTSGGGVMGRFDGLSASYGSSQTFKTNFVVGRSAEFFDTTLPSFTGISVDIDWLSVYAINQTAEGLLDRRAIGAEARYFKSGRSVYATLDYDVYFNALNAVMLTGNVMLDSGTSLNAYADHRLGPAIGIRNALIGATTTSVAALQSSLGDATLKQLALDRTVTSDFAQFSVTQRMTQQWQVGADFRLSQTSGLPTSGSLTDPLPIEGYVAKFDSTGLDKGVSVQLIGNNLYSAMDTTSLGVSYNTSGLIQNGESVFVYNRTSLDKTLYLDSSWRLYKQIDLNGGSLLRNMPMVRMNYRMSDNFSIDGDLGLELSEVSGSYQTATTTRWFTSFGFRWDL